MYVAIILDITSLRFMVSCDRRERERTGAGQCLSHDQVDGVGLCYCAIVVLLCLYQIICS